MTPRLAIFDMDDVLCDYDRRVFRSGLGARTGRTPADVAARVFDSGFDAQCDEGLFDADAQLAGLRRRLGPGLTEAGWVEARRKAITPRPTMLALVERVKRRVPVALLTNNGPLVARHVDALFPGLSALFGDALFVSGTLGAAKPDPEAFRRVAERMGVAPEEALFIDDSAAYIAGAVEAGLATHHFTGQAALEADLAARGLI